MYSGSSLMKLLLVNVSLLLSICSPVDLPVPILDQSQEFVLPELTALSHAYRAALLCRNCCPNVASPPENASVVTVDMLVRSLPTSGYAPMYS